MFEFFYIGFRFFKIVFKENISAFGESGNNLIFKIINGNIEFLKNNNSTVHETEFLWQDFSEKLLS